MLLINFFYSINSIEHNSSTSFSFSGPICYYYNEGYYQKQLKKAEQRKFKCLERDFLHEVGILSTISHPNCCKLINASYDPFGISEDFFMIFEKLPMDLAVYLTTYVYKASERFSIAEKIIDGVEYLHSRYVFVLFLLLNY